MNRRRAIIVALLVFVPLALSVSAEKIHAEKPVIALLRAEYFSVWGVSEGATPTVNEKTFRAFMEQRPSIADALRLINDGTPAGRVYGFLALKKLSPDQFAKLAPKFFQQRIGVSIMLGCNPTPRTKSTGKLIREISDGEVILHQRRE